MIPSYNNPEYLPLTLRSVLSQDPGPAEMQIEVVDDHSTTGDLGALVGELGGGRVGLRRQPRNVGMIENFHTCIANARGEFVHILHDDDVVLPRFYARARQAVLANPAIDAWMCRVIYMDKDGLWTGLGELDARQPGLLGEAFAAREFVEPRMFFASTIVRRSVYEELGGFRPDLHLCYDWDMFKRIALRKRIYYDPEPLACYRQHSASSFGRATESGESVADERRSIRISRDYLSAATAVPLSGAASKAAAVRATRAARAKFRVGKWASALRLLKEAMKCSVAPMVLVRVAWTLPAIIHGLRGGARST